MEQSSEFDPITHSNKLAIFLREPLAKHRVSAMNRTHPRQRLTWLALLAIGLMLISACSSTRMAYRYADWGIVWWVEDYLTLTDAQKTELNRSLDELRAWHCASELPRHQAWLDTLQDDMRAREFSPATLAHHQQRLFGFFPPLMNQITPIATRLLASLSDAQVRELEQNMRQRQQDLADEYLEGDTEDRIAARAERTRERAERWLGELNAQQRVLIAEWSEQRGRQTEIWLQGRQQWQEALLAALEHRHQPGFASQVESLILDAERFRGEDYREMMADSRAALNALMHELMMASDAIQVAHLADRAAELNRDLEALTCHGGAKVANAMDDQTVR